MTTYNHDDVTRLAESVIITHRMNWKQAHQKNDREEEDSQRAQAMGVYFFWKKLTGENAELDDERLNTLTLG